MNLTDSQLNKVLFAVIVLLLLKQQGCELPKPGPVVPPTPVVTAPFKTDKLAVLIVEETAERGKLPIWVNGTGNGAIRGQVITRGGNFRIFDKDQTDFSNEPAWVGEAFKVPHPELPWIVGAGPQTGFSQKLPANSADALKLLDLAK